MIHVALRINDGPRVAKVFGKRRFQYFANIDSDLRRYGLDAVSNVLLQCPNSRGAKASLKLINSA